MVVSSQAAYELFHEGSIALAQVEANGFRIDVDYVKKTRADLSGKIRQLETELREHDVYKLWRKEFGGNAGLSKRKQLGHLLFNKLGFQPVNFTDKVDPETGKFRAKVDEATFESLYLTTEKNDTTVQFLKKFVRLEKYKKADGTFLKGIEEALVKDLLHPTFGLNIAKSFRGNAEDPNAQNWPKRDKEISKLIRTSFIARNKHHIYEIDFGGNEIKSSICYHHDKRFIKDVLEGDMHRDTAAELFFCKPDQVSKESRQTAKNKFVFAQFFGDYYIHCAAGLWEDVARYDLRVGDVPIKDHLKKHGIRTLGDLNPKEKPRDGTFEKHVKKVEDAFWNERYKGYTKWKNEWWQQYVENGYCQMLTGFVVHGVWNRKQVINFPIQGTAFHWLLWCLIKIQKWLKKNKMRSMIVGQIHDSLILDVHEDELEDVHAYAVHVMTVLLPRHWDWICIPMNVEAEVAPVGASWFETEKIAA